MFLDAFHNCLSHCDFFMTDFCGGIHSIVNRANESIISQSGYRAVVLNSVGEKPHAVCCHQGWIVDGSRNVLVAQ